MPKHGLVVMTAMPPTIGHLALIEFASTYCGTFDEEGGGTVYVIVSTRDSEPLDGFDRYDALKKATSCFGNVNVSRSHGECPQNPDEHPDFWNFWKDRINQCIPGALKPADFLFASEMYGEPLAEVMDLQFVPYDVSRVIVNTKASWIRENIMDYFGDIIPEYQSKLRQTVTIFGAESCGKSTMTKALGKRLNGKYQHLCTTVPEWARLYLETIGPTVDEVAMDRIMRGQFAVQTAAQRNARTPFIVQDTDLLSTIGYFRIMGLEVPPQILELFQRTKADLYVVMNGNIPFEADPLRYGGDVRESTDQFWIDLLIEFQCNYHVVTNTDSTLQYWEVSGVIAAQFTSKFPDLATFVRT